MARSDALTGIPDTEAGDGLDLPQSLQELEGLLQEVRWRVRRHRDTPDMRLALRIEERIAQMTMSRDIHNRTHVAVVDP